MDFYIGCLAAIWLAAASATVWVYQIKARGAAEQLQQTTVDLSSRLLRLQIEKDRVENKYRKEAELLAAEKAASAEVELQKEPVKRKKLFAASWSKQKQKQCKAKKHKRSREWEKD